MSIARLTIEGVVDPAFRRVRDAFAANFERAGDYREVGAALAVYRGDACVVDLWAGFANLAARRAWTRDTLVNVWSTTKGLTALCVAALVDRGLIAYEDRVAAVWPEFAQAGKQDITIAQCLSHQAGLPGFAEPTALEDQYDWTAICARLARQTPAWRPGAQNSYHAMTFGWLAGEIVRRVSGMPVAAFAAQHIAAPLGADFYVGLPQALAGRVSDIVPPRRAAPVPSLPDVALMALTNPSQDPGAANSQAWRNASIPAANGHASAQGVARVYAALANDGQLAGAAIISPATLKRMTRVQTTRPDLMLGFAPHWAMGVATNLSGIYGPRPATFGHSGWGGSFGCADAETRIAIGYVMNQMGPELVGDPRTTPLCAEVFAAI